MKTLLPEMPRALLPVAERGAERQTRAKWWDIKAEANGEAELLIYDAIAWWGVDAGEFVRDLARVKASTLNVRINSPGGDVFGGVAIYNALVRHDARVVVHVDALAASIASIIAMAGDEVRMHAGSFMMIHDPFVLGIGNAEEFRALADWLEKIGGSMAEIYAVRTGLPLAEVQEIMHAETWFTAAEAQEAGFADQVEETPAVEARFDLSGFSHAPDALRAEGEGGAGKTPRQAERALRDAGFSREAAKGIVAVGFKAPADSRDATEGEPDDAAADRLLARMLNLRLETFSRSLVRN